MAMKQHGVLKARPIGRRLGQGQSPHHQALVIDEPTDYRVAVNVKSQEGPSGVEYPIDDLIDKTFAQPVLGGLEELPAGFTPVPGVPGGLALDIIRANLFDRTKMRPLPFNFLQKEAQAT